MKNKIWKIVLFFFSIVLLVLIRAFETDLFYDPFIAYFKAEQTANYPDYDFFSLIFNLFLRYGANSILSLLIIYSLFTNIEMIKWSVFLYTIFLLLLIVAFVYCLLFTNEQHRMILFYIRRFLIQPIFLLLFVAGFYFQKLKFAAI